MMLRTEHFIVGEFSNWAGDLNQLPPGFVMVTPPLPFPVNMIPVVQIMYVGEAAAEAVSAALRWAREAERELILDAVSRVCTSDQCDAVNAEIKALR